jgi:Fimbrial assembly protein (PilN)
VKPIDFLSPRTTSWLGWCLLAIGIATAAAALHVDRQWARERAEQEAADQARAAEAAQRRREVARPVPISADERRLQHIAPQLRQPWLPVLRVIESTSVPPVYLHSLSIDPGTGTVRLEGEAPNFKKVLEYVKDLDQEGLLGPAELRSHEQTIDIAGRSAVRFTVSSRWIAP